MSNVKRGKRKEKKDKVYKLDGRREEIRRLVFDEHRSFYQCARELGVGHTTLREYIHRKLPDFEVELKKNSHKAQVNNCKKIGEKYGALGLTSTENRTLRENDPVEYKKRIDTQLENKK